uniref:Uncharacterized protein n=1 Tax=Glossina pallidipes TaxID=7398 RepID=A0A1A9ZPG6_GLOPL
MKKEERTYIHVMCVYIWKYECHVFAFMPSLVANVKLSLQHGNILSKFTQFFVPLQTTTNSTQRNVNAQFSTVNFNNSPNYLFSNNRNRMLALTLSPNNWAHLLCIPVQWSNSVRQAISSSLFEVRPMQSTDDCYTGDPKRTFIILDDILNCSGRLFEKCNEKHMHIMTSCQD